MTDYIPPHVLDQPAPRFDIERVQTPAYVVDLGLLKQNLEKLAMVQREAGCKVLLAQKGFSMWSTYPLLRQYLSGCCASGLHEALLAHEEFGKEVHVYAPFFTEAEMQQIIPIACHLSFNSLAQWRKWRPMIDAARAAGHAPSPGIRVNPEHSEVEVALYDPCSPGCRLGIRAQSLEGEDLDGIEGLHFHALCEQDSDVLERTLAAVEKRFPKLLEQVRWVNMGGGHHITRKDYDVERLIRVVRSFKERWGKDVYLEPGEAVALNTGYLIASVMDIVGTAPKSQVASQSPAPTFANAEGQPHSYRYRTQADSSRAARALHQSLQNDTRGVDRANAAQRIDTEAESLLHWATEHGETDVADTAPLPTAILDISATAHMPDTLEMPYRPHILGAGFPGELAHTYRLGGPTCLAGDVVNDYSFPELMQIGQKLVFTDQAHYTMVKTTTFNGVPHPDIVTYDPETDDLKLVRRFGYEDFKRKLS